VYTEKENWGGVLAQLRFKKAGIPNSFFLTQVQFDKGRRKERSKKEGLSTPHLMSVGKNNIKRNQYRKESKGETFYGGKKWG